MKPKKNSLLFQLLIILLIIALPYKALCQESTDYTSVKTAIETVKIPGKWQILNTTADSGQTYLKNNEGIIIAVARNPMKAYPFYKNSAITFEQLTLFYQWDSDYYREQKIKVSKIKENATLGYIIWKYNDKKLDNLFLFGASNNNFLNLLVYTKNWSEPEKILFLENLFTLNR
ncbi:MAG: hypothetical protein ACK4M4_08880 [Flavobacterium sp.]